MDRLQQKIGDQITDERCDLLSVLLHLWIDYNTKGIGIVTGFGCDLLSVLLHLWIDYN